MSELQLGLDFTSTHCLGDEVRPLTDLVLSIKNGRQPDTKDAELCKITARLTTAVPSQLNNSSATCYDQPAHSASVLAANNGEADIAHTGDCLCLVWLTPPSP